MFVAFLNYDIKRIEVRRNGFFPCIKHMPSPDDDVEVNTCLNVSCLILSIPVLSCLHRSKNRDNWLCGG